MSKLFTAVAMSIALPAAAYGQATPAPKMECCEKMKTAGKDSAPCKGMDHSGMGKDARPGADPHAGHDMSKADSPASPPAANHQH